jgi:UDP-glucose 4-epimerase
MNYLITGGAGFVGSALAERLLANGHRVTVLDNLVTGYRENIPPAAVFERIDLRNDYTYHPGVMLALETDPPDCVFALAALPRITPSFEQPGYTITNNLGCTVQALEIARKHGAQVIYAGSSSAYDDPNASPYALSKYQGEQLCDLYRTIYGVDSRVVRFHNVYGGGDESGPWATVLQIFKRQCRDGRPLTVVSPGTQTRCFTHIDDIVDGLVAVQGRPAYDKPLSLGAKEYHSIMDIVRYFDAPHVMIPARPGDAAVILSEYEETERVLGWRATRSIYQYIEEFKASLPQK